ncbi:ThEn42 [Dichotomopilus funicola]|uniref:chitinase n=1 Tax=Dichotomopilus funicola TaxID=1934379 RepID=A0AAN6V111_9PEZI|nr:ThEn42 [Dichotomopilus funicola]
MVPLILLLVAPLAHFSTVSASPLSISSTPSSSIHESTDHVLRTINQTKRETSGYRNALYFTNWGIYGANYQPQQLPADKITHVLYAFADIGSDGEVKTSDSYSDLEKHYPTDSWNDQGVNAHGCVKQLYLLKKRNRQLKVLLSIGGWTYSPKFAPVAATDTGRQKFCDSAITLMKDWGFDGLDIDWEYPSSPSQAQDYVNLLATCRAGLDTYASQHAPGYHFTLTAAAPAGPQNYDALDLPGMDRYLDAWHLMAYDYAGPWDTTTGHQANLFLNTDNPPATKYSTDRAVADYTARGIAAHKIVLGLPLYGRAFEGTQGLGLPYAQSQSQSQSQNQTQSQSQSQNQTQSQSQSQTQDNGVMLYRDLPRVGANEIWDASAQASYSFDSAAGELVSYDTPASAAVKAQYILDLGLGGAVYWEASGDKDGAASLVGVVAEGMGGGGGLDETENLLGFPDSRYDNIRAGVPGE